MKRSIRPFVVLIMAGAAGYVPVACGGDKKPADNPPIPSASAPSTPASTGAVSSANAPSSSTPVAAADAGPSAPPLAQVLTTDPGQLAALLSAAQTAAPATLQAPGTVPGDPIEAGIKGLAATHAKGMQPDGQIAKGDLKEGDHLSLLVNLQAGKCYTIVGFSPKGQVVDLDLRLLAPPFYNALSGEDTTDDNAPVIGKAPNPMCPVIPVPIAYKVDIHAQKGAGKAGVQLFSKSAK